MPVEDRLELLRQIAEAVAYANGRGVFHRSLSPSAVLIRPPSTTGGPPSVRVTNWHTGARVAEGGTAPSSPAPLHAHIEALAASDAELYRAPEFQQPAARPARLDVFSLGALALSDPHRVAARSVSVRQLRQVLSQVGCLDPSTVADGVDPDLAEVISFGDEPPTPPSARHRSRISSS